MTTGKFAVDIGGASVTIPGVYSVTDKSAMVAPRGVPVRSMAIVASAKGGYVGSVTRVMAGDEERLLRSGVGAQMARAAFAHGMTEVFFVRVDRAEPAVIDLGVIGLFSINPGKGANGLQAKVAVNSTRKDAFDLFLKDATGGESDEEYRMLGPIVDLKYVGSGSNPTAELTRDPETDSIQIALSADGDDAATLKIDGSAIITAADMVNVVSRSQSWTASVSSQGATPINCADAGRLTFVDNKASIGGIALILKRVLEIEKSRIARAALPEDGRATPSTGPGGIRLTTGYEFFGGGTDGAAPQANDYIKALKLLEEVKVVGIAIGTDMPDAIAALASHVITMSGVKERRERFGGFGIAPTASKSEHIAKAVELASMFDDTERMVCASNNPFMSDLQTKRVIEQHGSVAAAAALAIKISSRPETPVTNKRVRFSKLKYAYNTEELETLIEGGVMPINLDTEQNRTVVVSGITTYTQDANTAKRKLAQVDATDYLQQKIRQRVTGPAIGQLADEGTVKNILALVGGVLTEEIRSNRNPNGVLVAGIDPATGAPSPAFRNLTAQTDGFDLLSVDFDCNLVGEIDKVRIRVRLTPVQIVARQ